MKYIVNTLYAILTWLAAFVVGFSGSWAWLGWSLLGMAALQTCALLWEAVTDA